MATRSCRKILEGGGLKLLKLEAMLELEQMIIRSITGLALVSQLS